MNKIVAIVAHEIREAIPAFLFFLLVFMLGRVTRALILDEYHITIAGTAVAVIGALIVAKAILVADALPITRAFADRAVAYSIVWTSLIYFLITFAFHYLEELIPLWRKYSGVVAAHERLLDEVSWPHFWVVQLWVAFSLLCYCTGVALVRAIGRDRARALFFGRRAGADVPPAGRADRA